MYYFFALIVPPNTSVDNPVFMRLPLDRGTISFLELHFAPGCVGLVRSAVAYKSIQIVPWNADTWLFGDDRLFKLDLNLELNEPPYELTVKGWSEDDTYPHTLTVGVMLVEANAVNMLQLLLGS